MSKVTEKILDIIKAKHIAPKPKWQFLLKRWLVWIIAILSALIGSLAFSVSLFRIVNNDWDVLKFLDRSPVRHTLSTLPYIWLVLIILFIGLAYYNARHTKGAYKYQAYWFVVASIVISLAVGGIFYAFGLAPRIHFVAQKLPFIKDIMYDRDKIWMNADEGFIAGEITGMLSGVGMFELEDLENKSWVIRPGTEYLPPPSFLIIEEGVMVRIFGEKIDEELFEAIKIMPYQMGPGIMKGRMRGDFQKGGVPDPDHMPFRQ